MFIGAGLYIYYYHKFNKVAVISSKVQKVGEVVTAPPEIVHIKNERLSYVSGAKPTENESSVNALRYKPTPDRPKHMA